MLMYNIYIFTYGNKYSAYFRCMWMLILFHVEVPLKSLHFIYLNSSCLVESCFLLSMTFNSNSAILIGDKFGLLIFLMLSRSTSHSRSKFRRERSSPLNPTTYPINAHGGLNSLDVCLEPKPELCSLKCLIRFRVLPMYVDDISHNNNSM